MNEIDQKIRAALRRDPNADPRAGEPTLAEEVLMAFRGRQRWLSTLLIGFNLAAFLGLVFAVMRFNASADVATQLRWGGVALVLLLIVALFKIWFWLEMHTNRVLREIKRIELLLVSRAEK